MKIRHVDGKTYDLGNDDEIGNMLEEEVKLCLKNGASLQHPLVKAMVWGLFEIQRLEKALEECCRDCV